MSHFTFLETTVIETKIQQDHLIGKLLEEQFRNARVTSRWNTGAGFYTYIEIAVECDKADLQIYDLHHKATLTGSGAELGFIMFFEDGYMHFLEGFCFSGLTSGINLSKAPPFVLTPITWTRMNF